MKKSIFILLFVLLFSSLYSQWIQQQTGITQNLNDICFMNATTGITVGLNGTMIRTTNGGLNWISIPLTTTQNVFSTCFPSVSTGYISGYTGFVIKTTNSGINWFSTPGCGINVNCISFLDSYTGITGGNGTLMCHTSDGGTSFFPRYIPASYIISGIHYYSSSLLVVCGTEMPGAIIYKSTNTGNNFSAVLTLANSGLDVMYSLNSVYFKNGNTGFAVGSHSSYGPTFGDIYRTTNSGNNWSGIASIGPEAGISLNAIHFCDSLNGFVVGNNGKILRSTNGGVNWTTQNTPSTVRLTGIHMVNAFTGYICGNSGTILKTTNGGLQGIIPISNEVPDKYKLEQNHPNPFNPSTIIRFSISENGSPIRTFGDDKVVLKVYNILGKEIATLVNEELKAGIYEINWNASGYASGIYYYTLVTDNFSETKKMVLIK